MCLQQLIEQPIPNIRIINHQRQLFHCHNRVDVKKPQSANARKSSRGLGFRRVSQVSYLLRVPRPSPTGGGANIRGTSFVGRFVLEYHPVPGGGGRGQVGAGSARGGSQSTSARRPARAPRPFTNTIKYGNSQSFRDRCAAAAYVHVCC